MAQICTEFINNSRSSRVRVPTKVSRIRAISLSSFFGRRQKEAKSQLGKWRTGEHGTAKECQWHGVRVYADFLQPSMEPVEFLAAEDCAFFSGWMRLMNDQFGRRKNQLCAHLLEIDCSNSWVWKKQLKMCELPLEDRCAYCPVYPRP